MPDFTFSIYRPVNIGGTVGFERAGAVTIRDDNGFRDDIFDDIEQAPPSETNGDQRIVASSIAELDVGDTVRSRGIYRMTNNDTGETFDNIIEVFSETAGNPVATLFIFTAPPPDWLFDNTNRTLSLLNSDGTTPYASIVCFAAGTRIRKDDNSEVPIEDLKVGDRVQTQDCAAQGIRWIGSHKVSGFDLMANPKLRPIRIKAGALGCNLPTRDLIVSPQHRILVRSKIAIRLFDTDEVLIPANKLVALDGIGIADDISEVEYFHILFDRHQVIFSNGAPTESLFTGPEAMRAVSPAARVELETLFPEICKSDFIPVPARLIPGRGKHMKQLVARHRKNGKPLLADA
ncbi:MAG: Hint domain-containing protein [Ruegeria sp.]